MQPGSTCIDYLDPLHINQQFDHFNYSFISASNVFIMHATIHPAVFYLSCVAVIKGFNLNLSFLLGIIFIDY